MNYAHKLSAKWVSTQKRRETLSMTTCDVRGRARRLGCAKLGARRLPKSCRHHRYLSVRRCRRRRRHAAATASATIITDMLEDSFVKEQRGAAMESYLACGLAFLFLYIFITGLLILLSLKKKKIKITLLYTFLFVCFLARF